MNKRLSRDFFNKSALQLARDLLGQVLVRQIEQEVIKGVIIETEAYLGPKDKAAHTYLPVRKQKQDLERLYHKFMDRIPKKQRADFLRNYIKKQGKLTPRTLPMFLQGGHVYVYLIYGMHYQFNISSNLPGYPEAVLVRAVTPLTVSDIEPSGPGKLCRFFQIDKSLNEVDLAVSQEIWLEEGEVKPKKIKRLKRVGVDYAQEYADKLWRFVLDT